jgi:hypothetical protein
MGLSIKLELSGQKIVRTYILIGPGLLGAELIGLVGSELNPCWSELTPLSGDLGLIGLKSLPSLGLICSSRSDDGNDCEGG